MNSGDIRLMIGSSSATVRYWIFLLYNFLLLILCLLSGDIQAGSDNSPQFRLISESSDAVVVEGTFPTPNITDYHHQGQRYSNVTVTGLPNLSGPHFPCLPYASYCLHLSSQQAEVEITDTTTFFIYVENLLNRVESPIDGLASEQSKTGIQPFTPLPANKRFPQQLVKLYYLGAFRDNHLWSLQIFPYQYDPVVKRLYIYNRIMVKVNVKSDEGEALYKTPIPTLEKSFLNRLAAVSNTNIKRSPARTLALQKRISDQKTRLKLMVQEDGLYKVTGNDFVKAGVEIRLIEPRTLSLSNKGNDVAIYVTGWRDGSFDSEDSIEFWGEYNRETFQHLAADMYRDPFSDTNIYWLSWGGDAGLWMAEEQGTVVETEPRKIIRPYSYLHKVHVEKDRYYDRLSQVQGDMLRDHWFFDSGIASATKNEYAVQLHHPNVNSMVAGRLRLMLSGRTYGALQAHEVSVFLNAQRVLSGQWQGQELNFLQSQPESGFSAPALVDGKNIVTVVNEVDASVIDYVLLNWFEIDYPRLYRAENNEILFGIPKEGDMGLYQFSVDGFTELDIDVYKLGTSKILGGRRGEFEDFYGFKSNRIVFQDRVSSPSVRYVAAGESAKKKPILIAKAKPANLRSTENGADYLVIAHNRFVNNDMLRELLRLREDQGLRTALVSTESIYDEFGHGLITPYAIKGFLKFAYRNWQRPALRYVLLVGDGCYNRRINAESDTLDLVPVVMRQTLKFGAAASDHWYSLITGDDELPDLCVGRLPARTNDELNAVINKIIQYETEPPSGPWRNRLLFIGGNGNVFRQQSESLIANNTPARFEAARLYSLKSGDVDPYFGGTADLLDYFDEGCAVMTFRGHGGGAIWADNSLFRLEDVNRIYSRGRLPFVVSLTCFTASFESPRARASLGEELLLSEDKGAVAMLGASGLGWVWNDYYLFREVLISLFNGERKTIGEVVAEAKISYMNNYTTPQVFSNINQYNLLGDPATRLVLPGNEIDIRLNTRTPAAGDTLSVSGSFGNSTGLATLDLIDSTKTIIQRKTTPLQQSLFSDQLVVPTDFPNGFGYCRAYVSDEMGVAQANAALSISLGSAVFDSIWTVPEAPSYDDSIHFFADLISKDEPDSVLCIVISPRSDTLLMKNVDATLFRSKEAFGPLGRGEYLSYYLEVYSSGEKSTKSKLMSLWIKRGSDLAVTADDIHLGGVQSVELQTTVSNIGDKDAKGVIAVCEKLDPVSAVWQMIGQDTVDVHREGTSLARFPLKSEPDTVRVRITIDAQNHIAEVNENNNTTETEIIVNKFNVSTILGTTIQGIRNDTLKVFEGFACNFQPGVIPENTVLSVEPLDTIQIYEQPDLTVLHGENKIIGFDLAFANGVNELPSGRTFTIWMECAHTDSATTELLHADIFRLEQRTHKWVKVETKSEDNYLVAQSNYLGKFAILTSSDKTPPDIEISIAGQPHSTNTFVSKNPEIWVLFQDENGIDVSGKGMSIQLNGRELSEEEFSLPDSLLDGNAVSVRVTPQVSEGEHLLEANARDCSGNLAETKSLKFKIVEQFELRVLGTYPNPFSRETTLVYVLTQPAHDLTVRIFTAAGRLVRKFKPHDFLEDANPLGPDYHELTWDGRDADENDVANGVYFCKIEAKGPSKTVEKIVKIARIR